MSHLSYFNVLISFSLISEAEENAFWPDSSRTTRTRNMKGSCLLGFDTLVRSIQYSPGWVYYHISNAMQYSNTANGDHCISDV